jgi:hypothetical protein
MYKNHSIAAAEQCSAGNRMEGSSVVACGVQVAGLEAAVGI